MYLIVENAKEAFIEFFLDCIKQKLSPNQQFFTAGGLDGALRNKAMSVTLTHAPQCEPVADLGYGKGGI